MEHIFLIGFMGAGKTSIGKIISKKQKLPFYDLDKFIINQEQISISEIFKNSGEEYFRKLERNYLELLLEKCNTPTIIALGGGTPCFFDNLEFINQRGTTVYLKASVNKLHSILKNDTGKRPLVAQQVNLYNFIEKSLLEREKYYLNAHYIIDMDGKTMEDSAKEIYDRIQV